MSEQDSVHHDITRELKVIAERQREKQAERLWAVLLIGGIIFAAFYYGRDQRSSFEKFMDARCDLEEENASTEQHGTRVIDPRKVTQECNDYLQQKRDDTFESVTNPYTPF